MKVPSLARCVKSVWLSKNQAVSNYIKEKKRTISIILSSFLLLIWSPVPLPPPMDGYQVFILIERSVLIFRHFPKVVFNGKCQMLTVLVS